MCAYIIFPWVVQLPSVKLFMLTELSVCTHRKRLWGLINKPYYVTSDKVVSTSVSSLETRNSHYWASSEFSALSQKLTPARYLRKIYMNTVMGDMGWYLLTGVLYLIKSLAPKPFHGSKLQNLQCCFFFNKKVIKRNQKLLFNNLKFATFSSLRGCCLAFLLPDWVCRHSKLAIFVPVTPIHLPWHMSFLFFFVLLNHSSYKHFFCSPFFSSLFLSCNTHSKMKLSVLYIVSN